MQTSNFSRNLQTFIFSNNLSHQRVADLINEEMERLDADNERVFMANDVWTIVGRGSTPRNHLVMVAIAKVIGISLEDLIINVYDMSDLYRIDLHVLNISDIRCSSMMCLDDVWLPEHRRDFSGNASGSCEGSPTEEEQEAFLDEAPADVDIEQLFNALDEKDQSFVLDLMGNVEFDENGNVNISLLTQVDMPLDGNIDLWVYYNNLSGNPVRLTYDWEDLAHYMSNYDYDPRDTIAGFVVSSFLSVFTEKLQIEATPNDLVRYYDMDEEHDFLWDDDSNSQNNYLVKILLDLDLDNLDFLYKRSLEHAKSRLAELEQKQENNKKED